MKGLSVSPSRACNIPGAIFEAETRPSADTEPVTSLILDFPDTRTMRGGRKNKTVVYNLSSLWYFVTAAQKN
jgi:hypothetical protein